MTVKSREVTLPPPPGPSPTLKMRKQQLVQDAICDAALQLFAEKGFDETTIDDVAKAAGVSRRSFFRYFESKDDLLGQGIVSFSDLVTEVIQRCPASYSLSEVFKQTVLEVSHQAAASPRIRQVMDIAARYPAAREAQIARGAQIQEELTKAFAERGGPKVDALTAQILASLTSSAISITLRNWAANDQADIASTVERVLAGLNEVAGTSSASSAAPPGGRRRKTT